MSFLQVSWLTGRAKQEHFNTVEELIGYDLSNRKSLFYIKTGNWSVLPITFYWVWSEWKQLILTECAFRRQVIPDAQSTVLLA